MVMNQDQMISAIQKSGGSVVRKTEKTIIVKWSGVQMKADGRFVRDDESGNGWRYESGPGFRV